jgi:hypothetical protein
MITPPFNIWARPFLTAQVPVVALPFAFMRSFVATMMLLRIVEHQCIERDARLREPIDAS